MVKGYEGLTDDIIFSTLIQAELSWWRSECCSENTLAGSKLVLCAIKCVYCQNYKESFDILNMKFLGGKIKGKNAWVCYEISPLAILKFFTYFAGNCCRSCLMGNTWRMPRALAWGSRWSCRWWSPPEARRCWCLPLSGKYCLEFGENDPGVTL